MRPQHLMKRDSPARAVIERTARCEGDCCSCQACDFGPYCSLRESAALMFISTSRLENFSTPRVARASNFTQPVPKGSGVVNLQLRRRNRSAGWRSLDEIGTSHSTPASCLFYCAEAQKHPGQC